MSLTVHVNIHVHVHEYRFWFYFNLMYVYLYDSVKISDEIPCFYSKIFVIFCYDQHTIEYRSSSNKITDKLIKKNCMCLILCFICYIIFTLAVCHTCTLYHLYVHVHAYYL